MMTSYRVDLKNDYVTSLIIYSFNQSFVFVSTFHALSKTRPVSPHPLIKPIKFKNCFDKLCFVNIKTVEAA